MRINARGLRRIPCLILGAALGLGSSGCGDLKENVGEKIGQEGYWRIERTRTSRTWALLNSVGFASRWLGDPGYKGPRWWYVSPSGERVFMRLLNGVSPDARDTDPSSLVPAAVERMAEWGITGFGCGTDISAWLPHAGRMGSVATLSLANWNAGVSRGVFESWYAGSVAKACESLAAAVNNNPAVLGILWDTDPPLSPRRLLLAYAAMKPDSASKIKLAATIRDLCRNDPGELKARMPSARSFDELPGTSVWGQYKMVDRDAALFARQVYAVYGKTVQAEVRARFPNYVNLGPLLTPEVPVEIIQGLAAYVDVLTFGIDTVSGRLPRRYLESVHEATGKPLMVLKFGRSLGTGTGMIVETPEGQGAAYRRGARGSAGLPFVVACGWTDYRDREGDSSGFLDEAGVPRAALAQAAIEVNPGLDRDHRQGIPEEEFPGYYTDDRFAGSRPTQEIERLAGQFAVDGEFKEWNLPRARLRDFKPVMDLDATGFAVAYAGWNEQGLAVAVEVRDDAIEMSHRDAYWREADFVEIFLDASGSRGEGYGPSTLHVAAVPRGGGKSGLGAHIRPVSHPGSSVDASGILAASSFASLRAPGGKLKTWRPRLELSPAFWRLEVFIPWASVSSSPRAEQRIGFNLIVHRQKGVLEDEMFWARPRGEAGIDHPSTWGDLVLKDVIQ